jgi:DNA-binding SARP family transcriptional activator
VAIYQGPLLAGLTLDDTPEFDTWLLAQREAAHRQLNAVRVRLALPQQAAGDLGAAIAILERLVQHDRLEEDAHRRLMEA